MADFQLTQTGEQVQTILNDAPTTKETAEQTVTDLATEVTNRENADIALQQSINENATAISTETTNRQNADNTLQTNIDNEATSRENADSTLQGNIDNEVTRAQAAEQANADDIDAIEAKIPAQASSSNQLADKDFVNSSIAINAADFRGTSEAGLTLQEFMAWADGLTHNVNDYIFWNTTDEDGNVQFKRYKWNGSTWAYEYTLNNSSFTATQWAAINSAITSGDVTKLTALPTRAQLDALLAAKQNTLTFDNTPISGSANPVTSGGIYSVWQAILTSISNEVTRAQAAEQANADDIDAIEAKIPADASSSNQLTDKSYVDSADTALQQNINSEATTRNSADNNLQSQINSEATTRGNADTTLQNNIDAEETRARAAESQNATDIDNIEAKIPAAATSSNQLADKAFVNSSIATNTANFRGTSATGLTYTQFLSWANGLPEKDANDYVFWNTEDEDGNKEYQRYKYDGSAWAYEYTLNNSSFTAEQWAAINSAITSGDKTKLDALPTRAQLDAMLAAKQDTLTFDTTPTANSTNPVHSGGIKAALDTKEPSLSWDDQPTQHSDNPVKSGGLYDIWQAILTSISTETTNRQNADTALQNNINAEATTRGNADTTLQNNINSEASTRSSADTTLQDNINSEITNRTNADIAITRHTRKSDFSLSDLQSAVADQNLEKYGLKVGDYKTINGHTYVIAGLNPMKGSSTPYRVSINHVGLIVIPHTTQAWNASGNTYTGADSRGAGYMNSDLHYYLKNTVLPMAQTDLGSSNLIAHSKLLSNAVNTSGYNRYGEATGCSSGWAWESDCYISALSEIQVYGSIVWSSSGFDTGEACRQLDVFRHYNMNEIFGGEYPWLRDVASASNAAHANSIGSAHYDTASNALYVAALILFH